MEWLNKLVDALLTILPFHRILVKATEGGVKYKHGRMRPVGPGTCWYWPLFTEVDIFPTNRQTLDLRGQAYMTADGKPVIVSGVVVYEVRDSLKAFTAAMDLDDAIRDIALGAIIHAMRGKRLDDVFAARDDLDKAIRTELAGKLQGWGVKVLNCFLSDLAPCRVIRLVGDGQSGNLPKDED